MKIKCVPDNELLDYREKVLALFPEQDRPMRGKIYDNIVQYKTADRMLFVAEENGVVKGFSYVTAKSLVGGKLFTFDLMLGRLITGHDEFADFVSQIKAMGATKIKFVGGRGIRRLARRYGFTEMMLNNVPCGLIELKD